MDEIIPKIPVKPQQDKLITRIQQRVAEYEKTSSLKIERPSDIETMQYLKSVLKVKTFKNTSLGKRGVAKPCFHPNGNGIIFVKGTTITL